MDDIIMPLFETRSACLLCISSPQDRDNEYSQMINAKDPDTGQPYFLTYQPKLACDRCMETEHPENCIHTTIYPPWKSRDKQEIVKFIMKGKMKKFQQESLGLITEPDGAIVSRKVSDAFKAKLDKPYQLDTLCRVILITCDPNAGADNETSLVASELKEGQINIVGMDSHACKNPDETEKLLVSFITTLRKHPYLENAFFIFVAERNTGQESGHMAGWVLKQRLTYCIKQREDRNYGWWTGPNEKMAYAFEARRKLKSNAVFFLKDWVCTNPWVEKPEERHKMTRDKFFEQMNRYRVDEETTKSGGTKSRISGKLNAEGKLQKGQNDDLFMTFTFNAAMWDYLINAQVDNVPYAKLGIVV